MNGRTALLIGATGLIGGHCLDLLLKDKAYNKIITLGRRTLDRDDEKLIQHVIDFDALENSKELIKADDVFCCLGTTIKKAGSQEAFRKVDFTYPTEIAHIASQNGAEQFLIVTSIGANSKSLFFYNRVKGETEEAISKIDFKSIQIFRPSLLLGERKETRSGERWGEFFLTIFKFLLVGSLRKYRSIDSLEVAKAMVRMAKAKPSGVHIYESQKIKEVARYGTHDQE